MKRATVLIAILLLAVRSLGAQTPTVSLVPFEALAGELQSVKTDDPGRTGLISMALQGNTQELALYSLGESVYVSLVESDRLDKQVGASASAQGSTSLVSLGSVPSILGIAVENGALYQSVSDGTVTFRLNPSGLAKLIKEKSYLLATPSINAVDLEKALNRVSGSASFNFKQGATPGTFTGSHSQLKEATVRVDIVNKRDPRHPSHSEAMRMLSKEMGSLVQLVQNYFIALTRKPGYAAWLASETKYLSGKNFQSDTELRNALLMVGDSFTSTFGRDPDLKRLATQMVDAVKAYRPARNALFESIPKSSALTFEYAFDRLAIPAESVAALPTGTQLPDISTARLIYGGPLGSNGEVTLNVSTTIFNSTVPGMHGSLRDVQVSGGIDFRLPEIVNIGKPVLTFAALGAFLHQQPFGAKVTVNGIETADGAIVSFQTKMTIPTGKSGVRIPISVTVSNRNEFVSEQKEVRGAFGITFDLDRLLAN